MKLEYLCLLNNLFSTWLNYTYIYVNIVLYVILWDISNKNKIKITSFPHTVTAIRSTQSKVNSNVCNNS